MESLFARIPDNDISKYNKYIRFSKYELSTINNILNKASESYSAEYFSSLIGDFTSKNRSIWKKQTPKKIRISFGVHQFIFTKIYDEYFICQQTNKKISYNIKKITYKIDGFDGLLDFLNYTGLFGKIYNI